MGDIQGKGQALDVTKTVRIRRSWRTLIFPVLLSVMVLLGSYCISFLDYELLLFIFPLVPLVVAIILIRPVVLKFDSLLEITPHHVRFTKGILSLKQKRVELPYEDLLGVAVERTLGERLLNIGNLELGTALRDRPEIIVYGIAKPNEAACLIRSGIDSARMRHRGRTAGPGV